MPVLTETIRRIRKSGANPTLNESKWASWVPWTSANNTGAVADDNSALSLTAFYRGVTLISRTLGGLPLQVFEEVLGNGKVDETTKLKSAETAYLWLRPNKDQTRQTFWERIFADEVRGNAFIFVEKDELSRPAGLWHIERRRVRVGRTSSGQKIYEVDSELPMIDYKDGGEIVHIPNWGDGLVGYDPVKLASQAIALGLSAEEYAARSFSQNGVPPGILSADVALTPAEADELSRRWSSRVSGLRNSHRVPVMGNGAKFQQITMDAEKMQLESLRKFQVVEIARLLGLPPYLLSDIDNSTSFGTGIEEQNRNLVQYNFQGHLNAVEQAISDALLVRELTNRYARFNLEGLLRGTTLQRYQAYAMGYGRWLTSEDIRDREGLPKVAGADILLAAANMVPIEQLGKLGGEG